MPVIYVLATLAFCGTVWKPLWTSKCYSVSQIFIQINCYRPQTFLKNLNYIQCSFFHIRFSTSMLEEIPCALLFLYNLYLNSRFFQIMKRIISLHKYLEAGFSTLVSCVLVEVGLLDLISVPVFKGLVIHLCYEVLREFSFEFRGVCEKNTSFTMQFHLKPFNLSVNRW